MLDFRLDPDDWAFLLFSLAVFTWAIIDTRRFLRFLSLNRKTNFSAFALMAIRAPGTVVVVGLIFVILNALMRKH